MNVTGSKLDKKATTHSFNDLLRVLKNLIDGENAYHTVKRCLLRFKNSSALKLEDEV